MKHELPEDLHEQIKRLCAEGDALAKHGHFKKARDTYWRAFDLVSEPREDWEATTWVLAAIGDSFFLEQNFEHMRDAFMDAVRCAGGLGNVFIHLRLGQAYYELGDRDRAADNLARAYMAGGRDAFKHEDPKYFALVEQVLKPPQGKDRLP